MALGCTDVFRNSKPWPSPQSVLGKHMRKVLAAADSSTSLRTLLCNTAGCVYKVIAMEVKHACPREDGADGHSQDAGSF